MDEGLLVPPLLRCPSCGGIVCRLFLWIAAFTGILIGFEWAIKPL